MQVNFLPLKVLIKPAFEQGAPAFGFGAARAVEEEKIRARTRARTRPRIEKGYALFHPVSRLVANLLITGS
jgi:hypothetical protein